MRLQHTNDAICRAERTSPAAYSGRTSIRSQHDIRASVLLLTTLHFTSCLPLFISASFVCPPEALWRWGMEHSRVLLFLQSNCAICGPERVKSEMLFYSGPLPPPRDVCAWFRIDPLTLCMHISSAPVCTSGPAVICLISQARNECRLFINLVWPDAVTLFWAFYLRASGLLSFCLVRCHLINSCVMWLTSLN